MTFSSFPNPRMNTSPPFVTCYSGSRKKNFYVEAENCEFHVSSVAVQHLIWSWSIGLPYKQIYPIKKQILKPISSLHWSIGSGLNNQSSCCHTQTSQEDEDLPSVPHFLAEVHPDEPLCPLADPPRSPATRSGAFWKSFGYCPWWLSVSGELRGI